MLVLVPCLANTFQLSSAPALKVLEKLLHLLGVMGVHFMHIVFHHPFTVFVLWQFWLFSQCLLKLMFWSHWEKLSSADNLTHISLDVELQLRRISWKYYLSRLSHCSSVQETYSHTLNNRTQQMLHVERTEINQRDTIECHGLYTK